MDEDAGVVIFTIQNRNPDLEREVTVQFTTTDGTATGNGVSNIKVVSQQYVPNKTTLWQQEMTM